MLNALFWLLLGAWIDSVYGDHLDRAIGRARAYVKGRP